MDKDKILQIIEAANMAPSGGNSLPWEFTVSESTIEVHGLPEKDHPILNFKNRGTYVALGALMENVRIKAKTLGIAINFEVKVEELRIKITLSETEPIQDDLAEMIAKRHSNRKEYRPTVISQEKKEYLVSEAGRFSDCEIKFVEGEVVKEAGKSVATDLMIFLKNQKLHNLLFKEILWREKDQETRSGLFIKTMEAIPPKSYVFRLLKSWGAAKFFNKIGLIQKIYEETATKASSSGIIGFILVKNEDKSFLEAGQLLENIWLRATNMGFSFQLVSGVLFLWQRLSFGGSDIFSKEEKELINNAYNNLSKHLNSENKIIGIGFRIGESDPPLAVSYKRPPRINWV